MFTVFNYYLGRLFLLIFGVAPKPCPAERSPQQHKLGRHLCLLNTSEVRVRRLCSTEHTFTALQMLNYQHCKVRDAIQWENVFFSLKNSLFLTKLEKKKKSPLPPIFQFIIFPHQHLMGGESPRLGVDYLPFSAGRSASPHPPLVPLPL